MVVIKLDPWKEGDSVDHPQEKPEEKPKDTFSVTSSSTSSYAESLFGLHDVANDYYQVVSLLLLIHLFNNCFFFADHWFLCLQFI
jgi:hypothetical protein